MEDANLIDKLPDLEYAQWKFLLQQPDGVVSAKEKEEIKQKLFNVIKTENMLPFYQHLVEELKWQEDQQLINSMKTAIEQKVQQLDDTIKDAVENLGESEVRDAMEAKAAFYAKIGDKEKAVNQYRQTLEKTIGFGQKLDIVFTTIRIGMFWDDHDIIDRNMEKARTMIEQGSDWDRRNRLKVYEAMNAMSIREFKKAAELLLDTISTFTAVELMDYDTFIFYTVLMCVVALDRVTIKKSVIHAPEILSVLHTIPHLSPLLNCLYNRDYAPFFVALGAITDVLKRDRYLAPHAEYFCKELRILAYSQMLQSYKSVQLESMATAFGVSTEFLDRELSRFIASGRLHCKIDKVGGIIESNRLDNKNAQYSSTLKHGDLLLNRVQKLSRVINL